MNRINYIYSSKVFLFAWLFFAFPMLAIAAAGKVEFTSQGAALRSADGVSKTLIKGMEINQGDTILTGAGRAQVKFSDGAYLSFQPNTEFKVEEYNFNGKQDGSEKGFFKLVKGGLRAISGLVGREHRPAYRLATPVATIGIRGSYYLAEFNEKLKAHVGQGSIYIFNEFGDIILFKGQGAEVNPGSAPKYSDEEMTIGARGPEGAQPDEVQAQQLAQNQNNNIFRVAEQYTDDGIACLNGDCGTISSAITNLMISSVITNLNGINAQAYYTLDNSVANNGGGMGWSSKVDYASFYANFGSYTMDGYVGVASVKGGAPNATAYDSFYLEGSILKSGSFALSTPSFRGQVAVTESIQPLAVNYYNSVCSSPCTMNVIGLFNGTNAEKANIGYVINGVSDGVNTGKISGTAGIVVDNSPR